MENTTKVRGLDVPIVKLIPLSKRPVKPQHLAKLVANIKAIGLIEPICIYKDGDQHFILDGHARYHALLELGVEIVPCLVLDRKDLYTANRQVNHLSAKQAAQFLREAIETLDEQTVGQAFGMTALKSRLGMNLAPDLHPKVAQALEKSNVARSVIREFTYVLPKRQLEILELMKQAHDESLAFVRAQVLRTPPAMRSKKKRRCNPWERRGTAKRTLARKLEEVEKQHDFYSEIYRIYVADLLKLSIYVRHIVTRPKLRAALAEKNPEALKLFESVMKESESKAAVA